MQYIDWITTQFKREAQRDPHHRSVRKDPAHFKISPSIHESIDRGFLRDEECVLIYLIGFGEGFDQIDGVGFISAQLSSDGMRIDGDMQDCSCSCVLYFGRRGETRLRGYPHILAREVLTAVASAIAPIILR